MARSETILRFVVDGTAIDFEPGDTLLEALLRAGLHPVGGGCLCTAGDCPHCLATVDGVGYVRTCQTPARAGGVVIRDHQGGKVPPLPLEAPVLDGPSVPVRYLACDVVVIGQGESGRAAFAEAEARGKEVLAFDASPSAERWGEAIGIYPGPLVVVRTSSGMVHVHPREQIVVATGAAEIQPVAPGRELPGIVTKRAAERLSQAGLDLGRVVAVGIAPEGVAARTVAGRILRFEGEERVDAVLIEGEDGVEQRYECDTVSVGIGLHPRDALARMANGIGSTRERVEVRVVGDAARPADLPACPEQGIVCPCSGIGIQELDDVWRRGFREMELVKRATLAGTGTCQGAVCIPYLRSFLADRGKELQPPFTARPLARQQTVGEIAAGAYHHATPRTALDAEHRRLGAKMERAGGWFRPWSYGRPEEEYRAVREAVSVCDVGTLGKIAVAGPDALELLERIYPTRVSSLRPGRSRYALLLDERGCVLDDGLICREEESPPSGSPSKETAPRFYLTFTSGGSTLAELWLRDWAEAFGLDVRLMNLTMSLGAINVTGPRAAELLTRAGAESLPAFGAHARETSVAGVDCRVLRLSFTGELSYELHHAAADSVRLWRRLLELGEDLGCRPHGLETLLRLRLEKGHIVVGQDTDYDSTARRIGHEWAVRLDTGDQDSDAFVGKRSVVRTNRIPLDRCLVGLEMDFPAPIEGAGIWQRDQYSGFVTSSAESPVLGRAVMLGWVATLDDEGALPEALVIDGRPAKRVPLPFYDPENARARVAVSPPERRDSAAVFESGRTPPSVPGPSFERIAMTRVVAHKAAIRAVVEALPEGTIALRTAPDELLVLATLPPERAPDEHAIVETETGFAGAWLPADEAALVLEATCEWQLPNERPSFAQGAVADLPVKLWLERERVLFLVPHPYVRDLAERIARVSSPSSGGGQA